MFSINILDYYKEVKEKYKLLKSSSSTSFSEEANECGLFSEFPVFSSGADFRLLFVGYY